VVGFEILETLATASLVKPLYSVVDFFRDKLCIFIPAMTNIQSRLESRGPLWDLDTFNFKSPEFTLTFAIVNIEPLKGYKGR
jgi:hypothetical protein